MPPQRYFVGPGRALLPGAMMLLAAVTIAASRQAPPPQQPPAPPVTDTRDPYLNPRETDISLGMQVDPSELPDVPPTEPADALSTFRVAPGFRLELVAHEPDVVDPVQMAFDEHGRLYVVEMRWYQSETRGDLMFDERIGRIRLLEDTDGDGRFDKSTVFADRLRYPSAVFPYDGGVYVGVEPDILFMKDTTGDGVADERRVVFTGFGNHRERLDSQMFMNSLAWGLDNRIHGAKGHGGFITSVAAAGQPDLDLRTRDFSFDPRTHVMRPESGGGKQGLSFDDYGHKFVCTQSTVAQVLMYEDRYAGRNPHYAPPRALEEIAREPGEHPDRQRVARISQEDPWRRIRNRWRAEGIFAGPPPQPPGYLTASTGITLYRGDLFPESYRNSAFVGASANNLVHRRRIVTDGVGFRARRDAEEAEFVASTDMWFRPVAFANGPEGALYIADLYREIIDFSDGVPESIKRVKDLNRGNDRGRIYRVVPEGFTQPARPRLADASSTELVATLDHPNAWHRETAARLLYERQSKGASGVGVVTATGVHTEIGRINRMIAEVQTLATPLTRQMAAFGTVLSVAILAMAALMFATGWLLHDYSLDELFFAAIGFAVAAIPEGLPAILTITLAIGVQRMARRNAITRRLNAVETLGSTTVICSDKTGTLTRNEMTVRHVVTATGQYDVEGTGYRPDGDVTCHGEPVALDAHSDLEALVEVLAVCNDTEIAQENGQWIVVGEPTEGALVTLARKLRFDAAGHDRLAVVPFESDRKFMATLDRRTDGSVRVLMKGAPDRLLDASATQQHPSGTVVPLDRAFWEQEMERLSAQGLRVLAAASRAADDAPRHLHAEDVEADMTFLGIVGIIDPPRPEAIEAIALCQTAGISVKMITGDHAGTALAIGREMGMVATHAVTGRDLEAASDEQLRDIVREHDVFARTSPEHKLRLVTALQANDEVVAMTGDGVNDAPALKRADVGVAMGIKGTEATKEAAEIVLADDNFASISRAVEEGRTIYDNLRKAIIFILPTNGAEGLVMFAAVALGLVLPLQPVQILWVNMVTAVTLALALAFEPAEPGVMARPPRDPGAPILGAYFLWRIAFVSLLIGGATIGIFMVARDGGRSIELSRTVAVNTLVFGQAFYLFNCRTLREAAWRPSVFMANGIAWMAVGVLLLLQLIFVYAPVMNVWFGSAPLRLQHWLVPVGIGLGVFVLVEIEKAVYVRLTPTSGARRRSPRRPVDTPGG